MSFRFDKLTHKSQQAVADAQALATSQGNPEMTPLHLLDCSIKTNEGIVRPLLEKIGVKIDQLSGMVESELGRLPTASGGRQASVRPQLQQLFENAATRAESMKDEFVSSEHLLLAMTDTESKAKNLLQLVGVGTDDVMLALKDIRGSARVTDANAEDTYQALEKFGIDLVTLAQQGKLDPVIGRDQEIRRVVQVLSRRTKNNPVLIGQPGVGKNRDCRRSGTTYC